LRPECSGMLRNFQKIMPVFGVYKSISGMVARFSAALPP
jgi:hypothetical protein